MMAHVPEDILQLIFDAVSPGLAYTTDPTQIPASAERAQNSTLAACALVCRSWAPHAQAALFRHIYIPATTEVRHTGNFWPIVQGSTDALPGLIRALERSEQCQQAVRTLHMGFGEIWVADDAQLDDDLEDEDNGALIASHLALVARAIALCTGLQHLSLYIGTPFDVSYAVFASSDLAGISCLQHVRQLSFFNLAEEVHSPNHIVYRRHYSLPFFDLGAQLIRAFQAQLTALTINFASEPLREVVSLPKLRTLRVGYMRDLLQIADHPTALKAYLGAFSSWEYIPPTIRHLSFHQLRFNPRENLTRFALLETLDILDAKEDAMLRVLGSAAIPSLGALHTVTLSAASVGSQDTVVQLREIFDALPALERVSLVGPRVEHVDYSASASVPVAVVFD